MGSSQSTAQSTTTEERRRRELEKNGILIPPLFGVPSPGIPLSPSVQERLNRTVGFPYGPSVLDYLHQSDPAWRISHDYLQTGVWIHGGPQVRAALVQQEVSSSDESNGKSASVVQGRLQVEQALNASSSLVLSGGTESLPSIRFRRLIGDWASIVTEASSEGKAWAGVNLFHTFPQAAPNQPLQVQLGSWLTANSEKRSTDSPVKSLSSVNGYAMMDFLGATVAVEANLPTASSNPFVDYYSAQDIQTRSYLSVNLSDQTPLHLTLEQGSDSMASISLSQTLSLDRPQLNPLEDRAPTVRNRLAWALTLQQQQHQSQHSQTNVSIAGAWQVNRALALKCKVQPNAGQVTGAVIFKRWEQPRITCSILWRNNTQNTWGIGLELETDQRGEDQPSKYYEDWAPTGKSPSRATAVPETKATLENEL